MCLTLCPVRPYLLLWETLSISRKVLISATILHLWSDCDPGCRRFESDQPPHRITDLRQDHVGGKGHCRIFPKRPEVGLTREQQQSRQLHGSSRFPAVSGYAKRGDTPNQMSPTGFDSPCASASAIPASAEPFRPACSYPKPPTRRTSQAAHVFFDVPVRIVRHVAQWLDGGRRVRLPLRPIRPRATWATWHRSPAHGAICGPSATAAATGSLDSIRSSKVHGRRGGVRLTRRDETSTIESSASAPVQRPEHR